MSLFLPSDLFISRSPVIFAHLKYAHKQLKRFYKLRTCSEARSNKESYSDYVLQQLHSEYRSTYTWHEYTGPQEHTVVRRAPQPPSSK